MKFGDLKSESGVKALNDYLAERSYIEGYQPSQADMVIFETLSSQPAVKYPHALRWYNHIKSYGNERASFPGEKKDLSAFGVTCSAPGANQKAAAEDDDDDIDLFGSDEEDEEAERVRQERLKQYEAKKAKKPAAVAKSNVILDVKPWDDETDMKKLEECVRTIECDGLMWGISKLQPLAYGIHKLQIVCVVEDDKVSIDWLQEKIQEFEEYVQSVDIAAFQKI